MTGFYSFLETIMPVKRILISLACGMVSLIIVLLAGVSSDFVSSAAVAERSFNAFALTALGCFIFLMSCEEFAIFSTKRELENLVDAAALEQVQSFNREEYLQEQVDDSAADQTVDNSFRPMDFNSIGA